jgi:phage shock protein A
MSKHGIIGRVTQLARADIGAIIDSADDPAQLLDGLIADFTTAIADAEHAVAQLIANLCVAEDDQRQDASAAAQWGNEADAASQLADGLRAAGEALDADKFDDLAIVALERQLIAAGDVETSQLAIAVQRECLNKLTGGLDQLKDKLSELTHRLDSQLARHSSERSPSLPRERLQDAMQSLDIMDPRSEVLRFGELLRREEMRARGAPELPASPLDVQFARLDNAASRADLDERLKAVKAGRAMAAAKAKVQAQAQDQPFR